MFVEQKHYITRKDQFTLITLLQMLCFKSCEKKVAFLSADSKKSELFVEAPKVSRNYFKYFCEILSLYFEYRNDPKFSDRHAWANSADPDQIAPRGAV